MVRDGNRRLAERRLQTRRAFHHAGWHPRDRPGAPFLGFERSGRHRLPDGKGHRFAGKLRFRLSEGGLQRNRWPRLRSSGFPGRGAPLPDRGYLSVLRKDPRAAAPSRHRELLIRRPPP